jgi:hypothetical protein
MDDGPSFFAKPEFEKLGPLILTTFFFFLWLLNGIADVSQKTSFIDGYTWCGVKNYGKAICWREGGVGKKTNSV